MADNPRLGFDIDTGPLARLKREATDAAAAGMKVADAADAINRKAAGATKAVADAASATRASAQAETQHAQASTAMAAQIEGVRQKTMQATAAVQQNATATRTANVQAQQDTKSLTDALLNFSSIIGTVHPRLGFLANAVAHNYTNMVRLRRATLDVGESLASANNGAGSFFNVISGGTAKVLIGAGVLTLIATKVFQVAKELAAAQDRWALYEGRLKLVAGTSTEALNVLDKLYKTSQNTGTGMQTTVDAFNRLARSSETLGLTNDEVLQLTDTVQKLGIVSGATQGELSSAMLQFSQALASGRLQGDELRSIMENMPALAKAIATGLGISIGQLREMGASGQLVAREIALAINKQAQQVDADFKTMPDTVERAYTRMTNAQDKFKASLSETLHLSQGLRAWYAYLEQFYNTGSKAFGEKKSADMTANEADQLVAQKYMALQEAESRYRKNPNVDSVRTMRGPASDMTEKAYNEWAAALMQRQYVQERDDAATYKKFSTRQRGDVAQGDTTSQQVLDVEQKAKAAEKSVRQLETAIESLIDIQSSMPADEFAEKYNKFTRALALASKEAEKARNPFADLERQLADISEGRGQGLRGGALDMFTKLAEAIRKANEASWLGADVQRLQKTLTAEATEGLQKEIDSQYATTRATMDKVQAIGKGNKAMDEAEVNASLAAMAMAKFGMSLEEIKITPEMANVAKMFAWLHDLMVKDKEGQRALSGGNFIQGLRDQLKVLDAQMKVAALGPYSIRQAEALANAEKSRREHGQVAYDLELKIFSAREKLAALTKMMNLDQEKQINKAVLAAGLDPRAINQARLRAQTEQESKELAPGERGAFVAKKMANEEDSLNASLRQRSATMKVTLDLQADELKLLKYSGEEYEAQKARLDKIRELREQGVDVSSTEAQLQIDISEAIARGNYAIGQRKEMLDDIRNGFKSAGSEVISGLKQMSDALLSGTKLSAQQTSEIIRNMATKSVSAIIENVMIKPIERAANKLLDYVGNWIAKIAETSFGGIGGIFGGTGASITGGGTGGGFGALAARGDTFMTQPFARGGTAGRLVRSPETFEFFGQGGVPKMGVRGEAKEEGVFPLTRGANGELGINMSGAPGVQIVVNDLRSSNGAQPVEFEQKQGPDGKRIITATIRDEVRKGHRSGDYDAELRNNFGVTRQLKRV